MIVLVILIIPWISFLLPSSSKEPQAEFSTTLHLLSIFLRALSTLSLAMVLILLIYKGWISKDFGTVEKAIRVKKASKVLYQLLVMTIILYSGTLVLRLFELAKLQNIQLSGLFYRHTIFILGSILFCVFLFLEQKKPLDYFRTNKPSAIVAAYYNEQYSKFVQSGDIQEAYNSLIKACENAPYGVELWCQLAFLCETTMLRSCEADKYMQKAKEAIESTEVPNNKEIACYENYLGYILCNRGQNSEGVKHIERSIELDHNPHRVALYEKKIAEISNEEEGITKPDNDGFTEDNS